MNRYRCISGVTFSELLVASALFLALMGSVFGVFISVLRTYNEKLQEAPTFRQASVILEQMSRKMREDAVQIIYPKRTLLFSKQGTSTLVVDILGEGKKERIGYFFDKEKNAILETKCDPASVIEDAGDLHPLPGAGNPRILGKGITALQFQVDRQGLLMIQLCVARKKKPVWLRTKTRWGVGL